MTIASQNTFCKTKERFENRVGYINKNLSFIISKRERGVTEDCGTKISINLYICEMEIEKILRAISQERFEPYRKRYRSDLKRGLLLYQANIQISQSFYSSLSILEVALRNAINDSFQVFFKNEQWYKKFPIELKQQIEEVENRLLKSKKPATIDRIIAELNFGFWTILFNRKYAKYFWKPLLSAFPKIPTDCRKRTIVSAKLNHIRTFRNRIYHYEPIIWDIREIVSKRKDIYEIMKWIEPDTEK